MESCVGGTRPDAPQEAGSGLPLAAAAASDPSFRCRHSSSQIVQVDAEQLEAEIVGRDRPLIIDFYATWCGPCVLLAKELETVRRRHCSSVLAKLKHTMAVQAAAGFTACSVLRCFCLGRLFGCSARSLLQWQVGLCAGHHTSPNIRLSTHLLCKHVRMQVAERMGDAVRILKIDTDKNPDISTQLQARGCWAC